MIFCSSTSALLGQVHADHRLVDDGEPTRLGFVGNDEGSD